MKKMKRTTTQSLVMLVLSATVALMVSSCGKASTTGSNVGQQNPVKQSQSAQASDTPVVTSASKEQPNDKGAAASNEKTAKGVYVGQIDGNSIEIKVGENATAFRYPQKISSIIEQLNENDSVEIKYAQNEYGQLILSEIRRAQ